MYVVVAECGAARAIVERVPTHLEARVHAREREQQTNCSTLTFKAMSEVYAQSQNIPYQD